MTATERRNKLLRDLRPEYTGAEDGEIGPLARAAFQKIATATDGPDVSHPVTLDRDNPRIAIVQEARKLIGGRETDGPNRSPAINALWQYTDYEDGWKDRAPYCAATVCACAHRAAKWDSRLSGYPMPVSPSVAGLLAWASKPENKCLVFAPGDRQPLAGDVCIYLPKLSHTGILALDYTGGGTIRTIEGNTSGTAAGDQRNGDGFWEKTRNISLVGHFIRLAED